MHTFKLIKLGLLRFRSDSDYRIMQSYIANQTITEIEKHGINVSNSTMLELGAGRGGYSIVFNKKAKEYVASDIYKDSIYDELNIPFKKVDVSRPFDFQSNYFDLVCCISLIEHISDPHIMLKEIRRILKPGGVLFLSFPPFYSLSMVGGHHFKPFHFLGEHLAIRITNFFRDVNIKNYATCYPNCGLYPLTINRVKDLITDNKFEIKDTYTRMSSINTTCLPGILKDLFTWHVCYFAQKSYN